jgi:hypothetical protein
MDGHQFYIKFKQRKGFLLKCKQIFLKIVQLLACPHLAFSHKNKNSSNTAHGMKVVSCKALKIFKFTQGVGQHHANHPLYIKAS